MEYNIYMTNDCNLMCEYCSVLVDCKANHIPIRPSYSLEQLGDFIEKTQEMQQDNEVILFFFGGEPTLEYDAMMRYGEYLKKRLAKYALRMILHTNGLLVNEMPDELTSMLSLVMYSINYEKIPAYNLKNSYFSTVFDNAIELKKKTDIPIVARLTVTEKTSIYTEVCQVTSFFDMVYWQIENVDSFENYEQFYTTYTYEIKLLFDMWLAHLRKGELLKYIPFMAVLKFMFYHDRTDDLFLCGYDSHMVYVQTDGKCYACCDSLESGQHYVGNIDDGIKFRGIRLESYICKDCHWRSICMGRCGRMHVENHDKNQTHIKEYCNMNEAMFMLFEERKDELKELLLRYPYYEELLQGWHLDIMEYTP